MQVTKCDLCKKKIEGEPVTAGLGFFGRTELCKKCGSPILKFLKRYKLINQKNLKSDKLEY